jgi:glycosyltransferase involved in cell wall biosynthesis
LLAKKHTLSNITFIGWLPYEALPQRIASWDMCLGIFGETRKADIVIPNKIYHYAAMKKAIVTKRTTAITEIFTDMHNIILCDSQAEQIAEQILLLQKRKPLREAIAERAHSHIHSCFNEQAIAQQFRSIVEQFAKIN